MPAQDTLPGDSTYRLGEVVIYSGGITRPITFVDLSDSVLQVKSTGQEASYIFAETPSVSNYSDAGSGQGYSYMRMRGIDQTRISVTYDGVPMNEPEDQGMYFSNYTDVLASVSKVQIQRGVGTSKNGVASYGGSIQLHSTTFTDSLHVFAGIGYGSFTNIHAFAGINTPLGERTNLYLRGSDTYSGGYKYSSSNHSQSIVGSFAFHTARTFFRINLLSGHQQNQLAWIGVRDSLIHLDPRTNANSGEWDNFQQHLVQLFVSAQIGRHVTQQTSVYYTYLTGNYDFDFNNFLGVPSNGEVYNYAFQSNLAGLYSTVSWKVGNFQSAAGIHGNLYIRSHTGRVNTFGELYVNTGHKQEASAFTHTSYTVNRFVFFGDMEIRMTAFEYRGPGTFSPLQWVFLNPKGGLSFVISNRATIYYSVGLTGREPTRNDLFGGNDSPLVDSSGAVITFITQSEQVTDHELGVTFKSQRFQGMVNGYIMSFRNEIVLNGKFGPNGLPLTNDVDLSVRTGIEVSAVYTLNDHVLFTGCFGYNYSRIREKDVLFQPILTSPFIGSLEAAWHNNRFEFSLTGRYQAGAFIDYSNTHKINAFFILNTRLSYLQKRFRFSVFINNLSSSKSYSSGYVDFDGYSKYFVQAPINIHASIYYSW